MSSHAKYHEQVKLMGGRRPVLLVFCHSIERARWNLNNDMMFRQTADNYINIHFVSNWVYKRGIHEYDYISLDGASFIEAGDKATQIKIA